VAPASLRVGSGPILLHVQQAPFASTESRESRRPRRHGSSGWLGSRGRPRAYTCVSIRNAANHPNHQAPTCTNNQVRATSHNNMSCHAKSCGRFSGESRVKHVNGLMPWCKLCVCQAANSAFLLQNEGRSDTPLAEAMAATVKRQLVPVVGPASHISTCYARPRLYEDLSANVQPRLLSHRCVLACATVKSVHSSALGVGVLQCVHRSTQFCNLVLDAVQVCVNVIIMLLLRVVDVVLLLFPVDVLREVPPREFQILRVSSRNGGENLSTPQRTLTDLEHSQLECCGPALSSCTCFEG
jgi:hypothetical protein